jgi:LmbE family N-acetylglucosaminyl deacetylase
MGYHPDHQVSGRLSLDYVYNAHLARLWPELGAAWRIEEMYFWAFTPSRVPDFYVDISANEVYARKQAAFLQMHSQYTEPDAMTDFLLFLASNVSATLSLPEGSLAEGYNYILW